MTASLLAAVISLATVVVLNGPLETPDGRSLAAGVGCHDGHATLYQPADFAEGGQWHEAAHVLDCDDDGVLNGSPGHPRPATYREASKVMRKYGLGFYCWFGGETAVHAKHGTERLPEAEWYACMVEATGDFDSPLAEGLMGETR